MAEQKLISTETFELIEALLARNNLRNAADAAFKQRYPTAPQEMIETATFHVFTEGIGAALEWVAAVEQFLRDPSKGIDYGCTFHLLYHLYNWQQFEALLPSGKAGLLGHLQDLKLFLSENDVEAAEASRKTIEEMLEGGLRAPAIERDS